MNRKDYCDGAPKACFSCPYKDCIKDGKSTIAETAFTNAGLGGMSLQGERKRRRKRRKQNDKQKIEREQGAG